MATRLKKRVAQLTDIVSFLQAVCVEIEFSVSDLPFILKTLSEAQLCSHIFFLKKCVLSVESGIDFPAAWSKAISENTPLLTVDERDKLLSFGLSLGTTDILGQRKMIKLFEGYFNSYLKNAEIRCEKFYRIYILLGTLAGFGMFILII